MFSPAAKLWEIESEKSWSDYVTIVRKELEPGFKILAGNEGFHCVKRFGDEVQYLDIELVSDKPLRVRCELMLVRDASE